MKRVLLSLLLSLGLVAAPLSASANSFHHTRSITEISGHVSDNGQAVKNAKVKVTCGRHSRSDKTNAQGDYRVQFKVRDCPDGSTVQVTVTSHHQSGTNSGTVKSETTKLNVAIVNVSVPELGWVTGAFAAIAAVGAFIVIRRRQLAS